LSIVSQPDDLREFRNRFKITFILVIISIFILLGRIWYLQIIKGKHYFKFSQSNSFKLVEIPATRGRIMDEKGEVFADSRPSYQALLNKQYVSDMDFSVKALSKLMGVPRSTIDRALEKAKGQPRFLPVVVGTQLNHNQLARLEVNKVFFPGLETAAVPMRFYPLQDATFHLLGYLSEVSKEELKQLKWSHPGIYKPRDWIGKAGIELFMDSFLKGVDGGEQVAVDAFGRRTDEILFIRNLQHKRPLPGNDVVLTINMELQNKAKELFERKEYAGSVVVMNVRDGSLLTLYSAPSLDPTIFARGITKKEWSEIHQNIKKPLFDKSLSGQYPPGSTYKIFMAAAGLEEKVITPKEVMFCPGFYKFGRRTYRCWKKRGHEEVALHKALVESCDVYFYQVGERLGIDNIAKYAKRFGLGRLTEIGINDEKPGLIPTRAWKLRAKNEKWIEGETLSAAIGQGFDLTTPIQMARATAALVNGGIVFRPWLVKKVVSPSGTTIQSFEGEEVGHIGISEESRKFIMEALRDVVQEQGGTAHWTRLKDIVHGGKTGTAQVVRLDENMRRLKTDEIDYLLRDHAWFVAFAPYENPEIALAVLVEHGGHGSTAAAPIARDLIKNYFDQKKAPEESKEDSQKSVQHKTTPPEDKKDSMGQVHEG